MVWSTFTALAVIFGVAYSFATFFESFSVDFGAPRAEVALVFGLSGLLYFVLGADAGILADRFGPRLVCSAGMLFITGGLLGTSLAPTVSRRVVRRTPQLRAGDRRLPAAVRAGHRGEFLAAEAGRRMTAGQRR